MGVKIDDLLKKSKKEQVDFLRWTSIPDLKQLVVDLKKRLFDYRVQLKIRALKQTHLISRTKRLLARTKTILSDKIKQQNGDGMKQS